MRKVGGLHSIKKSRRDSKVSLNISWFILSWRFSLTTRATKNFPFTCNLYSAQGTVGDDWESIFLLEILCACAEGLIFLDYKIHTSVFCHRKLVANLDNIRGSTGSTLGFLIEFVRNWKRIKTIRRE